MRLARTLAAAIAACFLMAVDARAGTFHYHPQIHVPAFGTTEGPAGAYPAPITVTGAAGSLSGVKVSLDWFTHQRPKDLDILLVAPGGQKVMLMSDAGGTAPVNEEDPEDLWFSSTATVLPSTSHRRTTSPTCRSTRRRAENPSSTRFPPRRPRAPTAPTSPYCTAPTATASGASSRSTTRPATWGGCRRAGRSR